MYAPWSKPRVFESAVDMDLLRLIAKAEENEHALLEDLDEHLPFSPYEQGGVTPASSVCSTPRSTTSLYTEDVLQGVNEVLAGQKRLRDEDGQGTGRTEFRKAAKKMRKKARKQADALSRDVLDETTPDVRSKTAEKYDRPLKIRVADVQAALFIARSSDVGSNRPAATELYSYKQCISQGWKYIKIDDDLP